MRIALLALLISAPVGAQVYNPPAVTPVDTSQFASKSDVSAASTAASNAQAAASAAQAAIPPVCAVAPSGDTLLGTVGTGTPCTPPINNTRPTSVQAGNTTLAANCTFAVTFARSFTSAVPFVYAAVVDSVGNQMPCKTQARSATGFSGICQGSQNTVLSLSVVTSGLTLLPFGTTCTAGTPVMFVGREPTQ